MASLKYTKGTTTLFNTTYSYTQNGGNNGQIVKITDLVDNGRTAYYTYDALGRRVRKTVSGATTEYFYLGGAVIGERQGAVWRDYLYFAGQRVAWIVEATDGALMHTDHLGSVRLSTLGTTVLGSCQYEPFGEVQAGSSCSLPTNYRFAGMEFDAETGLYHTWFRQYDPAQGRWMSPDPVGGDVANSQSHNRYAYVRNDPVDLIDPLGLCWFPTLTYHYPDGSTWTVQVGPCVGDSSSVTGGFLGGSGGGGDGAQFRDEPDDTERGDNSIDGSIAGLSPESPVSGTQEEKKTLVGTFRCAARGADRFDLAFLSGLEGNQAAEIVLGNVFADATFAVMGPGRGGAATRLVVGTTVTNPTAVTKAADALSKVELQPGIQTLGVAPNPSVPRTLVGNTKVGSAVVQGGKRIGRFFGRFNPLKIGFDASVYTFSIFLCD